MSTEEYSMKYIDENCKCDKDFARNIELLDKQDFSRYINEGLSLWTLRDNIEKDWDKFYYETYGMYVFDELSAEDTCHYFASRYNVWFQEYTDWVCRPMGEKVVKYDSN